MRRWAASSVKVGQDRGKYKKDLILSILKSTTTKREAREYLMKYGTELLLSGMDSPSQGRSILWNKKALPGQLIDSEVFRSETKMTSPKQLALIRLPTNLSNASYKSMIDSFDALRLLGISIVFLLDDSNECNNRGERYIIPSISCSRYHQSVLLPFCKSSPRYSLDVSIHQEKW